VPSPLSQGPALHSHTPLHPSRTHKRYYGSKLKTNADLKTTACCAATVPKKLRRLLKDVHDDVLEKFYGCGSPLPEGLEGCTVLDIGSGSGRDCFVGTFILGWLRGREGI